MRLEAATFSTASFLFATAGLATQSRPQDRISQLCVSGKKSAPPPKPESRGILDYS